MSTEQMQAELETTTAAITKLTAYTEVFLAECSVGNIEEAEKIREMLHTLLDIRLDSAMKYLTIGRNIQNNGRKKSE